MSAAPVETTIIAPGRGRLHLRLDELWAYRELLYFLVWRDVKVRYRHTVLGAAWALLQPVLTMAVFAVVFGRLAHVPSDGQPYALFVLTALVPWTYFATAVAAGANSLVGSEHLISKVYFPRVLIPAAAVLTPMIDFLIGLALVVTVLLAVGRVPPAAIVMLPLFVALAGLTSLAAALWSSALNVKYRDVRYLLPFFIQFWMFATPLAYPSSIVPEQWRALLGLNPMAAVAEGFRWMLLGTAPPMALAAVSTLVVTLALVTGFAYFRRMEGTFADVL